MAASFGVIAPATDCLLATSASGRVRSAVHTIGASMKDVRHVVFHAPGPAWRAGAPFFEQDGVQGHAAHWRRWLEAGKLAFGGPFLDAQAGGMMIPAEGIEEAELIAFAHEDPAVVSGLLTVTIRAWMVGMKA